MGTAETQPEKEKGEEGKSQGTNMERSKAGTREKNIPDSTSPPTQPNSRLHDRTDRTVFTRHGNAQQNLINKPKNTFQQE